MTKRSVILVGVLIVMVALGSAAIGVVSSGAATEAANGTYYSFLPLVMKAFPPSGYILSGNINMHMVDTGTWAAPFGLSRPEAAVAAREFIFPEECVAQNLTAILDPILPWDSGYKLYLRIFYDHPSGPSGNGVTCTMDDPATTCSSSDQLTIPAGSKVAINIYMRQGASDNFSWIPFSWECK